MIRVFLANSTLYKGYCQIINFNKNFVRDNLIKKQNKTDESKLKSKYRLEYHEFAWKRHVTFIINIVLPIIIVLFICTLYTKLGTKNVRRSTVHSTIFLVINNLR